MKNKALPILFAVFSAFPAILFGQDNEKLIKDYISQNKIREYKKSDLNNIIVDNVDPSKSLNGNVVKFLQTYNGLPVYSSVGTALIQDNKIVYYTDNFVKDYTASTSGTAAISKSTALQKIAEDLKNPDIANFTILEYLEKTQKKATSANQRLVYATDENGNLRLAYEYTLMEPKSPNYWNIVVDANNGNILLKNNLTLSCNFHHDAYSSDAEYTHADHFENTLAGPQNNIAQNNNIPLLLPDNASYNVFPLPIEAPTFGSRSIINNPWILSASPEGWHSDGTNHYTITRGNNVFAYEDSAGTALTAPDYLTGTPADGGATRNFDFPFNINETPLNNRNAAITNLFYLNNRIHDIFYKFGFTESARNFQQNNFGNGPVGGDDDSVYAEAQDGSGLNNANFSSGQDGYNGRMQMYLWSPVGRVFFYNAPSAAVTRTPGAGTAQFGNPLPMNGLTGDVALSSVLDGCTALPASSLTNKIGLVERGTCSFAIKVKNLQDAGAKAAIVYNNVANGATIGNMAGNDPTITIPSVLINNAEGEYIKTQLAASTTVNVTLKGNMTPDGSFDNGIVTHEYGHGISNRMTGTGYNCLNSGVSKEQMGEGWSDFFALMLTNKAGDDATVARGTGTYAIGQPITGGGIRPAKYSTNLTVNGFTYGNTNGMEYNNGSAIVPDVHSIGFVWATMLWDLHWKYVEKYGYASDVLSATPNGSTKVLQLVTDALKLQGCNPSFIDGRNAILAAEMATTQGQDKCMIWGVFARRGLGVNASAGAKNNINDQVQDFNVPEACLLATNDVKADKNNNISIYPNPAKDEFYIKFPSNTLGKVSVELYDMSGKLVSSEDKISPDAKKAISTSNLVNGTYMVKIKGLGFEAASKVMVKK
ncbi:T9SS-dependent M36 family metallopeptidase [Chryseobacterium candidae]|nr:T9SS-dependent M36 family metallopeptidase [Chryseobacterium candidae]